MVGEIPDGEVGQQSFAYDAVGNRTDSGADTDTGNRLTDLGAFSFTHDDEGRTLTKSASGFLQTYHWSDRSQLDSVTTIDAGDTTVVRYAYDGLGRRISRDGPDGFEEYLYDGPHVIAILDDEQDVVSTLSYYPGIDRPHSLMTDSETYYYATDPTGSVIGLAEFTGAASVTHRYRYDVWGKPRGSATEAVPNPLRFKARLWDEDTGLADFRARWYDPDIGRFISEDPIGLAGGINVYRFVGNDPVSGWDPFGLDPDGPCEEDQESTSHVVGYDPDTGIPILETLEVCVEGGPSAGVRPPMPSPMPGPAPLASAGKAGPGGGGNRGGPPERPIELHRKQCVTDLALFGAETAFDAIGFGVANAGSMARAAATGRAVSNASAIRDVRSAVGTTGQVFGAIIGLGNIVNPSRSSFPGTNWAQIGASTGSGGLQFLGSLAEAAKIVTFAGPVIQAAAAGRSCIIYGFSHVM